MRREEPDCLPAPAGPVTRRAAFRTAGLAAAGVAGLTLLGQAIPAAARPRRQEAPGEGLRAAMRKLWEDHITWTRLTIISIAAGLPDLQPTLQRLLQNQTDLGNAIKPFYGDMAGDTLTALLKEHITTAGDLVMAAKAGDAAKTAQAKTAWYANADQIAQFLATANPDNWPLNEARSMMREHLDLTLEEALARLQGNFPGDIAAYERIHGQILRMADMLTTGIVSQFPNRFPEEFGFAPDCGAYAHPG